MLENIDIIQQLLSGHENVMKAIGSLVSKIGQANNKKDNWRANKNTTSTSVSSQSLSSNQSIKSKEEDNPFPSLSGVSLIDMYLDKCSDTTGTRKK